MMKRFYAERALRAGARGYVMKREALDSILSAVRSVLAGEIYISPSMTKRMLFNHIHRRRRSAQPGRAPNGSGIEIFQLIGEGRDMHEIARQLHLSKKPSKLIGPTLRKSSASRARAKSSARAARWVRRATAS